MSERKAIVGVSKRYHTTGACRGTFRNAKRSRYVFYYDANGKFKSKKVGFIKGFWYGLFKVNKLLLVCSECGRRNQTFVRRKSLSNPYKCQRCSLNKNL